MRVLKIVFNSGMNEGYFVETRKGFVQVMFHEGEAMNLKNIKSKKEIRINEANLKVEEINSEETYIR